MVHFVYVDGKAFETPRRMGRGLCRSHRPRTAVDNVHPHQNDTATQRLNATGRGRRRRWKGKGGICPRDR